MTVEEVALKALRVYGVEHQIIKAIEELSELSAALAKWIGYAGEQNHVEEELADVEIMIIQLREILNKDNIDDWKINKAKRQEFRMVGI